MRRHIEKFLTDKTIQGLVFSFLQSEGYVASTDNPKLYKNMVFTKKAKELTGDCIIPKPILEKFLNYFPPEKRASAKILQEKFNMFFREHIDWFGRWELIRDAIRLYLDEVDDERYIMKFNNLILKTDIKDKTVDSVLETYIERILKTKKLEDFKNYMP